MPIFEEFPRYEHFNALPFGRSKVERTRQLEDFYDADITVATSDARVELYDAADYRLLGEDDEVVLQAALDAAALTPSTYGRVSLTSGIVYFSSGADTLSIPARVHLHGMGMNQTLIKLVNIVADQDAVTVGDYGEISDLTIYRTFTGC